MEKFKGTPGVWVADRFSRAVGPISNEDDQSYGMVIPVAYVEFDPEVEVQASNQNLIAAAPELLEALQGCLPWVNNGIARDAHVKAIAAIKKALGE